MPEPRPISAAVARRYLAIHHLLAPPRALPAGRDSVLTVMDRLGSFQFDPLGVAGAQPRPRPPRPDRGLSAGLDGRAALRAPRPVRERQQGALHPARRRAALLPHQLGPVAARPRARHAEAQRRGRPSGSWPASATRAPCRPLDFERGPAIDWYWGPTNQVRARPGGALGVGRHRARPARRQPPLLRPRRASLPGRDPGQARHRGRAAPPQAALGLPGQRAARAPAATASSGMASRAATRTANVSGRPTGRPSGSGSSRKANSSPSRSRASRGRAS